MQLNFFDIINEFRQEFRKMIVAKLDIFLEWAK